MGKITNVKERLERALLQYPLRGRINQRKVSQHDGDIERNAPIVNIPTRTADASRARDRIRDPILRRPKPESETGSAF
jgi:hypothetical protein